MVRFSLGGAKADNSKAQEDSEAKAREDKKALDKLTADFEAEHGVEKNVLGDMEVDEDAENVFVPTGSKRHFTGRPRTMKSGPGTLDAGPRDGYPRLGGTPGRSAPHMPARFGAPVPTGPAALEGPRPTENVYATVVAKVSNLPPDIDPHRVEEVFADYPSLKVTQVEKIPPQGLSPKGRPSVTMKVKFDKDANPRDLVDAMNKLNDKKYLGKGYYLHLDRYLGDRSVETAQHAEPFGARWEVIEGPKGFAPPPHLGGASGKRDRPRPERKQLIVTANQPPDMATLWLVHHTIERVILGGVEFEAALMNDPKVQEDERFAWLYDQKHPVNRYYRWRMHQIVCDSSNAEIFTGQGDWVGPQDPLPDEFADHLGLFHSEEEMMDSIEDEEKEKLPYKILPVGDNYPGRVDNGHGILSPRSRVELLWLLTSLPPTTIVADDIAAISDFVVEHAGQGMDEIVHILVSNIIQPFQLTDTNPRNRPADAEAGDDARRLDARSAPLNALRIVSDVLLVTAKEAGICYKYRLAICTELIDRKVFEHLEQLPTQLEMGRITEKNYKDEINAILQVWRDEHMFDEPTLNHFDEAFNARDREREEEEQARRLAEKRKRQSNVVRRAVSTGDQDSTAGTAETAETAVAEGPAEGPAEGALAQEEAAETVMRRSEPDSIPGETAVARARRLRPKAEDMFVMDEDE
ncbi:hypothetical protein yc1106_01373 [Curvularia clavata]|uniref:SURP motif domain-containing protein n=1 Tax=Curvularia clavata TaxID=95742 RepID=A0A9Q8Z1B7_CURCL|nr:hypothetical protein yc1106_01373 [Curvularia clavata]